MVVDRYNIGIQMKQKEPTNTFMMISLDLFKKSNSKIQILLHIVTQAATPWEVVLPYCTDSDKPPIWPD